MLVPYNVDVPMERWPIANWVVMGVTSLVSIVGMVGDVLDSPAIGLWLKHFLVLSRGETFAPLQLAGYMFMHAGPVHLIGNMIFLFCFGNAVNAKVGHAQFVSLYFLLGIIAGVGWMLIGSGPAMVGASGAIFGITGMFLVFYPRNDVSVFYAFWILVIKAGTFCISSYWVILLYVAFDLWGAYSGAGGVAYIAHLAGAFCGAGLAALMLIVGIVRSSAQEENLLQMMGISEDTIRDAW
ncbi:MAG: rhomboid family intramembrane serine protease [Planctomycetota bacterium]|jgi:membrane associated rhomboid family serine protease|nr:rhomboid family intramembrane serine protease [Planctomycetota bacterium]MDP7248005.1 rhomboid family intramembrane serine protease [Planctomycetota bacterium]|tara:strand:- start:260 stop:976 length:717 start_codon:yes stop_codon:yes gene_type:complete